MKEELEQAEQARKIEMESRTKDPEAEVDGDLVVLIEKWTGASRLAAEELFGKVRDRVNRYVCWVLWEWEMRRPERRWDQGANFRME